MEYAIRHNCVNFYAIPAKYINKNMLKEILSYAIKTTFDGGRHATRIMKFI